MDWGLDPANPDNGDPEGIWSDGTTMYVVENAGKKVYAYNLSDGARQESRDFDTHADNGTPTGIVSDGVTVWIADYDDRKLYAYNLSDGARQESRDFESAGLANGASARPAGLHLDGFTIWMLDLEAKRIYAYDLATKARDSSKDIGPLSAANANPYGVWSNGKTAWVSDYVGAALHLYPHPAPPPCLESIGELPASTTRSGQWRDDSREQDNCDNDSRTVGAATRAGTPSRWTSGRRRASRSPLPTPYATRTTGR